MTRRALELAALGIGQVSPGPLVGCVVVDAAGKIAGEGTYYFDDITHAEVVALNAAGERSRGGTAYISLEPHSHHGRTPPCTTALLEAGISRVVVPIEDPNPEVSGRGFALLKAQGTEVSTGLLDKQAERQNEKFIHWHRAGRPFVHLKTAISLDGKIATRSGDSQWITGMEARQRGQELRAEYDAILVGSGTVRADDPELTDRSGRKRRRPLARVVLDSRLGLDMNSRLFATAGMLPTIAFCDSDAPKDRCTELESMGVEIEKLDGGPKNMAAVFERLRIRDIQSVLVEGGGEVAGSCFDQGFVDKMTFFQAPLIIGGSMAHPAVGGKGVEKLADAFRLCDIENQTLGPDIEITGYPRSAMKGDGT